MMSCACHAKGSCDECQRAPTARRSHAKGSRGPAAPTRAAAPPGGSVYCACQQRPRAPQLLQDALCTAPAIKRQPRPQRRPRAPQLLQEALCTAPATQKAAAAPAAPTRAAAPPGGSVYCACHAKGSRGPSGAHAPQLLQEALCTAPAIKRQPRPQRRPRAPQLLQEALCTAPATQKAAAAPAAPTRAAAPPGGSVYCACHAKGSRGPSGAHARRSSSRRLCVLRLPRKRQPRPQRRPRAPQPTRAAAPPGGSVYCACHQKAAAAPAAPTRAAAPPGGSVYCACHAKGSRGPSGAHARRSPSRRLCVLRLPSKGSRGPSGAHARRSSSWRLCVLRLPRKRQPRPQRRPRAPQLLQEALCTAPAIKRQPRPQRRPRAPQLLLEALCTAPATQKAATAPAAPTRAAAPPGGSVYCACHAKGSRGPSGAHARCSSSRRLCVLRLPHQRQRGSYLYSE